MSRGTGNLNAQHEIVVSAIVNTTSTDGVTVNSSASVDTMGTWVTDTAYKPTFDWNVLQLYVWNANVDNMIINVGVDDGSANRYILCERLRVPGLRIARSGQCHYSLPLYVPKGRQLAFQCQCAAGSNGVRIVCGGSSYGPRGATGFAKMVALYTPVAGSRGVSLDPGASANTKSGWVDLVASTASRIGALMLQVGDNGDIARAANQNMAVDIGVGSAGNERVVVPNIVFVSETNADMWLPHTSPVFACDIPAGSKLAVRGACSVATAGDRRMDVAMHGFIP